LLLTTAVLFDLFESWIHYARFYIGGTLNPWLIAFVIVSSTLNSTMIFADDNCKSLKVPARLWRGNIVHNNSQTDKVFNFVASGLWSVSPDQYGFHSSEGVPGANCRETCMRPLSKFGALIAVKNNGRVIEIGLGASLLLKPGEKLALMMNDEMFSREGIGYEDNDGEITVSWCEETFP
jgi:hypothetical protein